MTSEIKEKTLEALPCPFCGGAYVFSDIQASAHIIDFEGYYVSCLECLCRTYIRDTKEEALAVWNKRV